MHKYIYGVTVGAFPRELLLTFVEGVCVEKQYQLSKNVKGLQCFHVLRAALMERVSNLHCFLFSEAELIRLHT